MHEHKVGDRVSRLDESLEHAFLEWDHPLERVLALASADDLVLGGVNELR